MKENHQKSKKNKYQLIAILCIVVGLFYGYLLYVAIKAEKTDNIIFNSIIMLAWLLIAFFWIKRANRER